MTKRKADCIVSAMLICFSVAVLVYTKCKVIVPDAYVSYGIGPQTLPTILGWVILILSIFLFLSSLAGKTEEQKLALDKQELKIILIFIAAFAVYIVAMPVLGFYVATALFLIVIFHVLKVEKKLIFILTPGTLLAVYVIFTMICEVYLPSGLFV